MKQHTYLAVTALISAVLGAQSVAAPPAVQQTSFDRSTPREVAPATVRFSAVPSRVGDHVEQKVASDTRLTLTTHRAGQLLGKDTTTVRSKQRRLVTATAADGDRTTAVRVQYVEATRQVLGNLQPPPDGSGARPANEQPMAEPVQGKTYLCKREPGENGKLVVMDETGQRPPSDELEIVAQQMDSVGRPNPLAKYLAGRSVAVGERLEVPLDIARQIINWGDKFGKISRFTLSLGEVKTIDGAACVVFTASLEAESHDASQMRLELEGPLTVQIDTCRAIQTSLLGPLSMTQSRGTHNSGYRVNGTGRAQISITSTYRAK